MMLAASPRTEAVTRRLSTEDPTRLRISSATGGVDIFVTLPVLLRQFWRLQRSTGASVCTNPSAFLLYQRNGLSLAYVVSMSGRFSLHVAVVISSTAADRRRV